MGFLENPTGYPLCFFEAMATDVEALLARLGDSDKNARLAAVELFGTLDEEVKAQHVGALLARFEHSNRHVRTAAVEASATLGEAMDLWAFKGLPMRAEPRVCDAHS